MDRQAEAPPAYGSDYNTNYGEPTGAYPDTQFSPYGYSGPAVTNQNQNTLGHILVIGRNGAIAILPAVPADFMGLAVFATVCCFPPLGIFAIRKARESRAQLQRGDASAARISAIQARRLSLISVFVGAGLLTVILITVMMVLMNRS